MQKNLQAIKNNKTHHFYKKPLWDRFTILKTVMYLGGFGGRGLETIKFPDLF